MGFLELERQLHIRRYIPIHIDVDVREKMTAKTKFTGPNAWFRRYEISSFQLQYNPQRPLPPRFTYAPPQSTNALHHYHRHFRNQPPHKPSLHKHKSSNKSTILRARKVCINVRLPPPTPPPTPPTSTPPTAPPYPMSTSQPQFTLPRRMRQPHRRSHLYFLTLFFV